MPQTLLRHLQQRRFRLLIRWKKVLLERDAFRVPHLPDFPHRLVIRVFEGIVHALKRASSGQVVDVVRTPSIIDGQAPSLTADQYAEILWAGREIVMDYLDGEACASRFGEPVRQTLHACLQRVFPGLVEREIRELRRLESGRGVHSDHGAVGQR